MESIPKGKWIDNQGFAGSNRKWKRSLFCAVNWKVSAADCQLLNGNRLNDRLLRDE